MEVKTLTIVVVLEDEKPPAVTLTGNLSPPDGFAILHDFMLQQAREEGKTEVSGKAQKKKRKATQQTPTASEGGSGGQPGTSPDPPTA